MRQPQGLRRRADIYGPPGRLCERAGDLLYLYEATPAQHTYALEGAGHLPLLRSPLEHFGEGKVGVAAANLEPGRSRQRHPATALTEPAASDAARQPLNVQPAAVELRLRPAHIDRPGQRLDRGLGPDGLGLGEDT